MELLFIMLMLVFEVLGICRAIQLICDGFFPEGLLVIVEEYGGCMEYEVASHYDDRIYVIEVGCKDFTKIRCVRKFDIVRKESLFSFIERKYIK